MSEFKPINENEVIETMVNYCKSTLAQEVMEKLEITPKMLEKWLTGKAKPSTLKQIITYYERVVIPGVISTLTVAQDENKPKMVESTPENSIPEEEEFYDGDYLGVNDIVSGDTELNAGLKKAIVGGITLDEDAIKTGNAEIPNLPQISVAQNPAQQQMTAIPGKPTPSTVALSQKVALILPWKEDVAPETATCTAKLVEIHGKDKVFVMTPRSTDTRMNVKSRMASRFLESGAAWSLWLGKDIAFPVGDAKWLKDTCGLPKEYNDYIANQDILTRLLVKRQKVLSAVFFTLGNSSMPMFGTAFTSRHHHQKAHKMQNEIVGTHWVGLYCTLIHRDVFEAIKNTSPDLIKKTNKDIWVDFFKPEDSEEDYISFSKRVEKAKIPMFVDTYSQCIRAGRQFVGAHNVPDNFRHAWA